MSETCQNCACSTSNIASPVPNVQSPKKTFFQWAVRAWALIVLILGIIFHESFDASPLIWLEWPILFSAYLPLAWPVLRNTWAGLRRGDFFDENFLMTIATIGAMIIHQLPEALGVMVFYTFGEFFQDLAVDRSRKAIRSTIDQRPETVRLLELIDSKPTYTYPCPSVVPIHSLIEVRAGERIALDGIVEGGSAWVDTASLTGESKARRAEVGSTLFAGYLVQDATLTIRSTASEQDSANMRILELIEGARARKAPAELFIRRFAKIYTPIVVLAALVLAFLPPLLGFGSLSDWAYRALVLLVISCPCALVLSIPLGYFAGLGAASRRGLVIKGSHFLDRLAKIKILAFDKTGTLTEGNFALAQCWKPSGTQLDDSKLWSIVASLESHSSHPIARALLKAAADQLGSETATPLSDISETRGYGISARLNDAEVLLGNESLLALHQISLAPNSPPALAGTSLVHLALAGQHKATFMLADALRSESAQLIKQLRGLGIQNQLLLSGDHHANVQQIALQLGLNQAYGELTPAGKLEVLESLSDKQNGTIAFVGDGMNDAPVLARADIGIAMGNDASDSAIEAADVLIMGNNIGLLADAIIIGRRTRQIVFQSIVLALGVKVVFFVMGGLGLANLWEAVIADVGVALLAILNASRALRLTRPR